MLPWNTYHTVYHLEDYISRLQDVLEVTRSQVYFHPLAGEPFGISIVEAMASGLIPIVPAVGGSTEFVPSEYQYRSIEEAADIISNVLNETNDDNTFVKSKISNLVSKFSIPIIIH